MMESKMESKKELIEDLKKEKQGSSPLFTDSRSVIRVLEESLSELSEMWYEARNRVDQILREQTREMITGLERSL